MKNVYLELKELGGVASVGTLKRRGCSISDIEAAVASEVVGRIRKGWIRSADAPPAVVSAVALGGRLGCVSAAAHLGLWTQNLDGLLHVSLPRHAGHALGRSGGGRVVHWQSENWGQRESPVESVETLLAQMLECQDPEIAIAAIDSALNRRQTTIERLTQRCATLPVDARQLLAATDSGSQSGLESICRFRLSRLGVQLRSQVEITGVGRIDLLIGDRIVVEADGRNWHANPSAFEVDRTRDLALSARGYVIIRLSYRQIIDDWALVELCIRGMISRGEHLWSGAHRRAGLHGGA